MYDGTSAMLTMYHGTLTMYHGTWYVLCIQVVVAVSMASDRLVVDNHPYIKGYIIFFVMTTPLVLLVRLTF